MSSHETSGILIDDGPIKSSPSPLLQLGAGCHPDRTCRTSSQDEKRYPRHAVHRNDSQSSSSEYDSKGEPYKGIQSRHSRRHAKDRSRYLSSCDESSSSEHGRRMRQSRQPRRSKRKGSNSPDRAGDDSGNIFFTIRVLDAWNSLPVWLINCGAIVI